MELWLGYSPGQPRAGVRRRGGRQPTRRSRARGSPTLSVVAQDRRTRLAAASPTRWFGVPIPHLGVMPLPDVAVAPLLALEHGLLPTTDPLGALLSAALGAVEAVASIDDPTLRQRIVRKQAGRDVAGLPQADRRRERLGDRRSTTRPDPAAWCCTLMSPAAHLAPDVTLRYGALAARLRAADQHGRPGREGHRPGSGSRPSGSS